MQRRTGVASLLLAAVVVCASFGALSAAAPGSGARASAPIRVPSIVTDALPLPAGVAARPLAAGYPVPVTLTLASPHAATLAAFVSDVANPASPLYHHFLTYPQYVEQFSPSPSAMAAVAGALRGAGATSLSVSPDRFGISATLPAAGVQSLFGVELEEYGAANGSTLYTAVGALHVVAPLQGLIAGVDGLSATGPAHLLPNLAVQSTPLPLQASTGPGLFIHDPQSNADLYVGSDFTQAYNASRLFPGSGLSGATYPTGVAVATLLASGYNASQGVNLPPWDPSVITTYFNDTFPSAWPKPKLFGVPVTFDGLTPPLPGSFGKLNDSTPDEIENSLDLEMAGSLAPGASIYNFYFAGNLTTGNVSGGTLASAFAQSLAAALAYNYSPAHLGAVSGSFGLPDLNNSFWNQELSTAAATGVSVVIASGDQGNAPDSLTGRTDGPTPTWPGSAAFNSTGSTAVGGVSLTLQGLPTGSINSTSVNITYDPYVTGVRSMSAWWDTSAGPGAYAGTEGGISTLYPEPYWQRHSAAQPAIVNATVLQGAPTLGRAEPDVAFAANTTIATVFANSTGTIFALILGGTSVAAPVFAGLIADELAVRNSAGTGNFTGLGYLSPMLYRAASYFAAQPGSAVIDPFLDVTVGGNYLFSAGPGWDPTTGWGGLDALRFLTVLGYLAIQNFNYTGPVPGLPPPSSSGPVVPWTTIFLIFGVSVAAALGLVLLFARPKRRTEAPALIPFGAHADFGAPYGPPAPGVPGSAGSAPATFACPYCGAVRPAEPVRCPRCGAF